ncbi:MAG: EAL domain-containing protein [Roseiarcus sp.]|jgi:diguanylate cyclase (GGDEF)-like protein
MGALARAFEYWPGKLSRLVRRQAPLFTGAGVLIGLVVAGTITLVVYLYDRGIEQASSSAVNLSHVISYHTNRSLQPVSLAVSDVVERLRNAGVNSIADLESVGESKDIQAMLRNRAAETPSIDSLFIVGVNGTIGGRFPYGVSDSECMAYLRDAAPGSVYVSTPFQSMGTWLVSFSKRISARDGAFLGAVTGLVNLATFNDLFDKVVFGEHRSLFILRTDGALVAWYPQGEMAFGSNVGDGRLFKDFISKRRDGVLRQKNGFGGMDRMLAVANSPNFPVAAVVAVSMNDIVADWVRQTEGLAFAAGVIVLSIIAGVIGLADRIDQLSDARQREAVQAQLAIQYKRFNNAMDNIVQGVALYDRDNTLIACNKRYAEIYGLPDKLTKRGVTRAQILDYLGDQGFGKVSGQPRTEADGSILIIAELSDGRVIAQRKKELADGGLVSTYEDITVRCRAEQKVQEMATSDALTGLANRFEFKQRLDRCLDEVRRRTGKFAVFYLDLDHFKAVNDSLGHPVGDKLLQEVTARIKAIVRNGDTVARIGGDEFAIIQRVERIPHDTIRLAERLIASVSEPHSIDGNSIVVGTSIGISVTPTDSVDSDELIRNADMALYHSKVNRGSYNFFTSSMDEQVRSRRVMENDLRIAIAEGQFELYFQPVVSVADRQVKSFEALVRWKHPERGIVAPGEFISLAEENGLIVPIGEWVLRQACREVAKWPEHIKVAVNVSAVQFKSPVLLESIFVAIEAAGIEGSRLIVEVTESLMLKDAEQAVSALHSIRDMGIAVAMDDFGTGYSSLSYLRRFPFDKIKIDKSFVSELGQCDESTAIVRAATSLAKALGMETVAEGVETEDQLTRVGTEGCSEAQGYLFSRPMPACEVLRFLGVEPQEVSGLSVATAASQETPEARRQKVEVARISPRSAPAAALRSVKAAPAFPVVKPAAVARSW